MAEQTTAAKHKGPVVVSVINLKGGVGKTTCATLLAHHAARINRRSIDGPALDVLAIDLDPQANMSQALMTVSQYREFMEQEQPSIVELFSGRAVGDVAQNISEWGYGQHLIPSRFDFAETLSQSVKNPRVLDNFIRNEMADKDLVVIDCPPSQLALTEAAYHASDCLLIPVKPDFFATVGFPLLKKSLNDFYKKYPGSVKIKVLGVLINHAEAAGSWMEKQVIPDIREWCSDFDWPVMTHEMDFSKMFPRAMMEGDLVGKGEKVFRPIANEFLQRVDLFREERANARQN